MKQKNILPNLNDKSGSFWLRCPFCQLSFVAHLIRQKAHGFKRTPANGAIIPNLDPDDLNLLAQNMSPAQIAEIYGVPARKVVDACRAFGIKQNNQDEQS